MSVSIDSGGKGGKKAVNADLNLVPYIDLLTCMVAFLLITAVWTQLARLQAQQKGQSQAGEETITTPQQKVVVLVNDLGFNLITDQQKDFPKKGEDYDFEGLSTELRKLKEGLPDKNDAQVASEDQIKFETLVKTMDTVISSGFVDISLIDSGAAASM
jgi:biopolymer transport protein TolR